MEQIHILYYTKIKNTCYSKDTVKSGKIQILETGEDICRIHIWQMIHIQKKVPKKKTDTLINDQETWICTQKTRTSS